MNKKMKAAFLYKPGDVRIEKIDIPKIETNEVLIEIKAVGICGSDIHYFKHGNIGNCIVKEPLILGHEAAGEIVEVGENVKNWKAGDRVTIEPGVPCRKCNFCKEGRYNLCKDVIFMATPPVNGAFTEYIAYPGDFLFRLPDNLSYEEGAMMEPLSVGVYSAKRGKVEPGKTVAILGMGTIGLVTLQAARAFGASQIIVTDIEQSRLDFAKKLGADYTLNAREDINILNKINNIAQRGVDVAIEAAGEVITCQQAISMVKKGGTVVLIGQSEKNKFDLDVNSIITKELDIKGIFRYANMYQTCIDLVNSKKINVKNMVSKHFNLDETLQALKYADENKANSIKTMILINS